MNLPASAIEFLDAYRGLYRELYERHGDEAREEAKRVGLPIVHCYCFTKDIENAEKDICEVSPKLPFLESKGKLTLAS
jgi:tRNA (guanine37-N1)-methyltransferase